MSAFERRISGHLLFDFREIAADARAEIREWTARVNERDQQNLPTILPQRNMFPILIVERKIRHVFPGGWYVHGLRALRRRGFRVRSDFHILQPEVGRLVL